MSRPPKRSGPPKRPGPVPDRSAPRQPGGPSPRTGRRGPRPQEEEARPPGARFAGGQQAPRPAPRGPRPSDRRPSPAAHGAPDHREPAAEAPREKPAGPGTLWIYGHHAVAAALANPARRNRRLLLTAEAEPALAEVLPKPWRLTPERVERARFHTFLPEDSLHQGAALLTEPLNPPPLDRVIQASPGPVLLLDQVTDPRNVGAILRSAAAFGAAAVVVQDRHAPPETGALARAASGALELVPMLREVNLARVILALQKAGFWVIGLDGGATATLAGIRAQLGDRRVALVLGAEGGGLRRLQRETCDELARLPIDARMESLNVSNAAAVALYEFARG